MRNLILAAFAAFMFVGVGGLSTAEAARCDDGSWVLFKSACKAADWAATAPAPQGPISNAREDACLRILVPSDVTEIVLTPGTYADINRVKPITWIRASAGHVVSDRSRGIAVKEFCFSKAEIRGLHAITICSGRVPGQGAHHTLTGRWLHALQRHGHAGDYLSLLGVAGTESGDILATYNEALYARQYGFRLR